MYTLDVSGSRPEGALANFPEDPVEKPQTGSTHNLLLVKATIQIPLISFSSTVETRTVNMDWLPFISCVVSLGMFGLRQRKI